MVEHAAVAHAVAAACAVQQVRRVGHAFHAAGNHHINAAGQQRVMGKHRRLHARAAHFVEGGAAGGLVQPGAKRGLACRGLAEAGRQYTAEQHFIHGIAGDAGTLDGGANRRGAQLRRGQAFEIALEPAHGGACGADNYDGITHDASSLTWLPCARRRRDGSPRH